MHVRTVCIVSRCRQTKATYNHQHISSCCHEHTQTNLHRSLRFLAQLGQPAEESNADGSKHHHEAGIELLEDGSTDGDRLGQLGVLPVKEGCSRCDETETGSLTLCSLALEERETTKHNEDSGNKVPNIKHH